MYVFMYAFVYTYTTHTHTHLRATAHICICYASLFLPLYVHNAYKQAEHIVVVSRCLLQFFAVRLLRALFRIFSSVSKLE